MVVVLGSPMLRATGSGSPPLDGVRTGSGTPGAALAGTSLAGVAALTAAAAAQAGSETQLVGRIGDDREGDALVLALGRAGVGHAAVLRDPARRTPVVSEEPEDAVDGPSNRRTLVEPTDVRARPALDPADVELALNYLTDYRVLVVPGPLPDEVLAVAADAARFAGAQLVVVRRRGDGPEGAIVLRAPDDDPDGVFARLLGTYAAALDRGEPTEEAFRSVAAALGWERTTAD